jgi:DNA polymerase-1
MAERPVVYLVDGSSYIYRAFFAIRQQLSTASGLPTKAVFGFKNMLQKLIRDEQPQYLGVVFDERGPTFRHELDQNYKAHRPPMPDELEVQIPYIHRLVDAFDIPRLSLAGYEADDILGTLARRFEAEGYDVVLVSGDKDLCQLVTAHTTILDTMKDQRLGVDEVRERFGVGPEGVVDVLGLMGDSSDNIPGVPGIGEKTAKELLATFGSLEALLARVEEVKRPKLRENLRQHAEVARQSRVLATIDLQTPIDVTLEALHMGAPHLEALRTLYAELEFRTDLQALGPVPDANAPAPVDKQYRSITTLDDLEAEIAALRQAGYFAVDTETTNQDPMLAELVGLSLAHRPHEAVYIPLRHAYLGVPSQLDAMLVLERLRPLLEDASIPKYGQNIKYDYIVLQRQGITMQGLAFDTMIAGYLLNPSRRMNNLDALAQEYLQYKTISYEEVAGKGARQITFDQVEIARATAYSAEDADVALLLTETLRPRLEAVQLASLFHDVEMPLVEVLADLEMRGVMIDAAYLRQMSQHLQGQMETLLQDIHTQAGEPFNVNSPPQLQHILFDVLHLPPGKKTKTGYSTDVSVLENLALIHELPQLILDYRHLAKMKSTYVDALPQMIHPQTGRIHTSFNQTITETGRLSSSNPNLQNIPIRSELGREMRRAFIAAPGHVLVSADYSQIELRLLAHLSGDPVLIEAFRAGEDIHTRTAMEVFNVDRHTVDGEMRRMAKTVNFGILYGLSPFGLAQRLRITNDEARRYIDSYFARYPRVKACLDGIIATAREQGYVTTLLQRRRYLPDITNANRTIRDAVERTAINMPFQGSAADLIKLAMIHLYRQIVAEHLPCHMLLQIHDELLFEIPADAVTEMVPRITETMENVWQLEVPLTVEVGQGHTWAEAH